jgi:hypothetical protein
MEDGDQGITFVHSLLATLPFTKQGKEAKEVFNLEKRLCFFKKEKERVDFLQDLVNNNRHREALRELVSDTTVENPIQYYNRLHYNEQQSGVVSSPNTSTEVTSRINEKAYTKTQIESVRKCKWSGLNKNGIEMKCDNAVISLPWKNTNEGVFSEATLYLSNFCEYHQKFCIDVSKRHENKLKRIVIPNELGLCSDCYVLKTGNAPRKCDRYPGLKRKHNLIESKVMNKVQPLIIKRASNPDGQNAPDGNGELNAKSYDRDVSQVIAAGTIRRSLRKSIARSKKNRQYEIIRLENMAAVWIQSLFRYSIIKKRIQSRCANGIEDVDTQSASHCDAIPENTGQSVKLEHTSKKEIGDRRKNSFSDRRPECMLISNNNVVDSVTNKHVQIDDCCETQCKRTATMCHMMAKNNIPWNHCDNVDEEGTIDCLHAKLENLAAGWIQSLFQDIIMKKRTQPCNNLADMLVIAERDLETRYKQPERVVNNTIPGTIVEQDGHERYVDEAQNHDRCISNLRNSDPECLHIIQKKSTLHGTPNSNNAKNCDCSAAFCQFLTGKRHDTKKQGLKMVSEMDLKRTFQRRVVPDRQINVQFQSFQKIYKRNRLNCYSKKIKHLKDARREVNSSLTPKNEKSLLQTKQTFVPMKPKSSIPKHQHGKRHVHRDAQIDKMSNSQTIPAKSIIFSTTHLSSMLEHRVQYHKNPLPKRRESTPCPYCKMLFFDKELAKKHLINRHTPQEIEYHMKLNDPCCATKEEHSEKLHVDWKGYSVLVPPLPSPLPELDICDRHVPPHPKCKTCTDFISSSPLFPPIRFHEQAFMHISKKNNERTRNARREAKGSKITRKTEPNTVIRSFHFDTNDKDLAVIWKDPKSKQKVAKIVCLCKDARNKSFLGVQCYLPCLPDELIYLAQTYNLQKDEWVLDSKVEFIEMNTVLDRRHVFLCHAHGLDQRRKGIRIDMSTGATFAGDGIKFCRFVLKNNDLIPVV